MGAGQRHGLGRSYDTAVALRDSGLDFVLAPILAARGEPLRRLGRRYTIALFPFVDGHAGEFGQYQEADRSAILAMLAELYAATPIVACLAATVDLGIPGRRSLESALHDLDRTWSGAPFSEGARQLLARQARRAE